MKASYRYTKLLAAFVLMLSMGQMRSQCGASFNYTMGPNGAVFFVSTSTASGIIYSNFWNYGNTFTSTVTAGTTTYNANGIYTVSLVIMASTPNCTSVATQTLAIANVTNPVCALAASAYTSAGSGGSVSFYNSSVGTWSNTTYQLNFGDGSPTSSFSSGFVSHIYPGNGNYTATLTADNHYGTCTSSYVIPVTINNACSLSAAFNFTSGPNGAVAFASTSTTSIGTPTMYSWSFGGSAAAASPTLTAPTVTYNANGIYTVSLFVATGSPYCNSQITHTVNITNVTAPVCNLTASMTPVFLSASTGTFYNASTGTVSGTSYTISFGDASAQVVTSNFSSVAHSYSATGNYSAVVIASNPFIAPSCTSSFTVPLTISNVCNLSPSFTVSQGANGVVNFVSTTTGTTASTTYTVNWGDGSPAVPNFAPHTYTANGVYPITLIVSNNPTSGVCTLSVTNVYTITTVCGLYPNFTLTQQGNGYVTFNNTSTVTGTPSYTLNWGDGSPSTGTVAAHQYTANGNYTVSLGVSFISSCFNYTYHVVSITNACSLTPSFILSDTGNGNGLLINNSTGTASATTYTIAWGDGNFNGSNPHTYSANGVYTATIIANNNPSFGSCAGGTVATVTIGSICNLAPGFSLVNGANGLVTLSNTSTGTTSATTYTINWGDGNINGPNPHQYTANANYTVSLSANNNSTISSCAGSTSHVVYVSNYCTPMNPAFTYTVGNGGHVFFTSQSTGTSGATSFDWTWDHYPVSTGPTSFSADSLNADVIFAFNGTYVVTLTLHNLATPSCTFAVSHTLTVNTGLGPCNAAFTYTVGAGNTVSFTSLLAGTTPSTAYSWNYGDSTAVGSGSTPVHTYSAGGVYFVHLVVTNLTSGSSCYTNQTITVTTIAPCSLTAGFSHTVGSGGTVLFENTSAGSTSATACYWNFGDGYTGTGTLTSHTYISGGGYNVKLKVTDISCADSTIMSLNVTGAPCNANAGFTMVPSGMPQVWNAIPSYPWNISGATWDWGDGSTSNTLYTSHTYSAAGNYSVCLTAVLICGDTATYCAPYYLNRSAQSAQIIYINVLPPPSVLAGIAAIEATEQEFSIYPNPNDGEFTLKLEQAASSATKLTITDIVGTVVFESEDSFREKVISLAHLPAGIYFINTGATKTHSKKLIISR